MGDGYPAALAELLAVADDEFTAMPLARGGRMYGGETAARALAAAQRTVPPDRAAHVVRCDYLWPGDSSEPLRLRVYRLRDGRAFSMRRVDVEQCGRVIFTATASFHAGAAAFGHHDPMPEVPAPEELGELTFRRGEQSIWPDWLVGHPGLDVRPVPVRSGAPPDVRAAWYRVTAPIADSPALHACLWLYASDLSLVASIRMPHERTERKSWLMTSLNHTVWLHRPFRVDEWVLMVQCSPVAGGGRGLAQGRVFTRDGVLVSTATQEGLATAIPITV